jgi:ABC-type sugar transport system ATPase subunit
VGSIRIRFKRKNHSSVMLVLRNISKSFSGVRALHDVTIGFNQAEVHALCGENGAGKSTLMNIIAGNLKPDSGTINWNNAPLILRSTAEAKQLGIAIVYQEGSLSDALSVAENIFAGTPPVNHAGLIDFRKLHELASQLLQQLKVSGIDPRTAVSRLSAEQKKLVEIAKALAIKPSLLILDEPTASITNDKTEVLFHIIQLLKSQGVGIIYISHRMEEIMRISDRISVLKDGVLQGTTTPAQSSIDDVIRMMVGRNISLENTAREIQSKGVLLQVEQLQGDDFEGISLEIKKGEIFGLAGLQGSGRTSLARTIFGDLKPASGRILLNGKQLHHRHPEDAMNNGIAYIPEDRKLLSLFLQKSVQENIAVSRQRSGWHNEEQVRAMSDSYVRELSIKTPSSMQQVRKLSGGNQQKVVIAKWLSIDPDLLIVNEPTHGVDVGARSEIYQLLKELTERGKSILLISSDLPELLLMCHRIGVMYRGKLKKIFSGDEATEEKITAVASGL